MPMRQIRWKRQILTSYLESATVYPTCTAAERSRVRAITHSLLEAADDDQAPLQAGAVLSACLQLWLLLSDHQTAGARPVPVGAGQ